MPQHDSSAVIVAGMGTVDGVMTLSAAQALFYNQSALILSGLPNTTQYVTYPPMPKAGAVTQVKASASLSLWAIALHHQELLSASAADIKTGLHSDCALGYLREHAP